MKPGQSFELHDFISLQSNHVIPLPKTVHCVGRLDTKLADVTLNYLDNSQKEILLTIVSDGHTFHLLLELEEALPPRNRKQLITDGVTFLLVGEMAPDERYDQLQYSADITDPQQELFLKVTEMFHPYEETPWRDGLEPSDKLYGTLVLYKAQNETLDNSYLVALEVGDVTNSNGGLVSLYKGRPILPHEIK